MLKRVLKYIGLSLGILILLLVALGVFLSLSPGEDWLRGMAEEQLSGALGQPVTIGRLETNLLSHLQLEDVTLTNPNTPFGPQSARIGRLDVSYRVLPLISGELALSSVIIDTLTVSLARDSAGALYLPLAQADDTTDAPAAKPDTADGAGFTVRLDTAAITPITIRYTDNSLPMMAHIRQTSLSIGRHNDRYVVDFDLDSAAAELGGIALPAMRLKTQVGYAPDSVRVDTLHLQVAQMHLSGRGTVGLGADTSIDASVALYGQPDSILTPALEYLGLPQVQTTGEVSISAQAGGTLSHPTADADASVPAVSAGPVATGPSMLRLAYRADTVLIDTIHIPAFGGQVTGHGAIALDTVVATNAALSLDSLDIEDIWEALYEDNSPFRGRFSGSLTLANDGMDVTDWRAEAALRGRQLQFENVDMPNLDGGVSFDRGRVTVDIA
ncbi:AsmA family protein, partial [candidate division GN15 bacterium]|nr:AsmA family protein [candidate division GN15 bacterium]